MTNKCRIAFCDVVHLANKMSRNTIKILLTAKEPNHSSSQVPPLQGAITGEYHMQRESMTL